MRDTLGHQLVFLHAYNDACLCLPINITWKFTLKLRHLHGRKIDLPFSTSIRYGGPFCFLIGGVFVFNDLWIGIYLSKDKYLYFI